MVQFLDYDALEPRYPDYDYSLVERGQVCPYDDIPLIHRAILDCGYLRKKSEALDSEDTTSRKGPQKTAQVTKGSGTKEPKRGLWAKIRGILRPETRESVPANTDSALDKKDVVVGYQGKLRVSLEVLDGAESFLRSVRSFDQAFNEILDSAQLNAVATSWDLLALTYCASGVMDSEAVTQITERLVSAKARMFIVAPFVQPHLQRELRSLGIQRELQGFIDMKRGRGEFGEGYNIHADQLNEMGWELLGLRKYEEAILYFRQCITSNPRHALAMNNMAIALIRLQRVDEAIQFLDQAIDTCPNFVAPYSNKGRILGEMGKTQEAEHWFRKALEIKSDWIAAEEGLKRYASP